ncbi:hypothetical protein HaLaN_09211 [Haematococcus lacustris]|uniref:Uncharacterized protein n=1 Tax=Haematococcus lacustris TaxID=44745 RepID=A0A699Z252_HAELA|nr:hypothetical protein HaLaN_09211 [Haematococcus lacustris]
MLLVTNDDDASPSCSFGGQLSRLTGTLSNGLTYWLACRAQLGSVEQWVTCNPWLLLADLPWCQCAVLGHRNDVML